MLWYFLTHFSCTFFGTKNIFYVIFWSFFVYHFWTQKIFKNTLKSSQTSGIISTEWFSEFEKKKTGIQENSSSGTKWTYEKSLRPFYTSEKVPRNLSMTPRYLGPLSPWEHFFEWNPNRKIEQRFCYCFRSVVNNIRIPSVTFEMSISSRKLQKGFSWNPSCAENNRQT